MRIHGMANIGVFPTAIQGMLRHGWFLVVRPVRPDGWELLGMFPSLELAQGYAGGCFEDDDRAELVCVKDKAGKGGA